MTLGVPYTGVFRDRRCWKLGELDSLSYNPIKQTCLSAGRAITGCIPRGPVQLYSQSGAMKLCTNHMVKKRSCNLASSSRLTDSSHTQPFESCCWKTQKNIKWSLWFCTPRFTSCSFQRCMFSPANEMQPNKKCATKYESNTRLGCVCETDNLLLQAKVLKGFLSSRMHFYGLQNSLEAKGVNKRPGKLWE